MKRAIRSSFLLGCFLFSLTAHADTILMVNSSGILTGATGVLVNGEKYAVEFRDGSCYELFGVCDSSVVQYFTFTSSESALAASQALLDQLFVGPYDDLPQYTFGCGVNFLMYCAALTPYGIFGSNFLTSWAQNMSASSGLTDAAVLNHDIPDFEHTGFHDNIVYSIWTPIPEPSSYVLLGTGLLLLVIQRHRRRQVRQL